jgi:hypothetical protein
MEEESIEQEGEIFEVNGLMSFWNPLPEFPEVDQIVCIQITEQGEGGGGLYCKLLDYPDDDLQVSSPQFISRYCFIHKWQPMVLLPEYGRKRLRSRIRMRCRKFEVGSISVARIIRVHKEKSRVPSTFLLDFFRICRSLISWSGPSSRTKMHAEVQFEKSLLVSVSSSFSESTNGFESYGTNCKESRSTIWALLSCIPQIYGCCFALLCLTPHIFSAPMPTSFLKFLSIL